MALEINDTDFKQEVEDYAGIVMVDFWAPWCGACVSSAPAVDALASEFEGKIKVVKINVDESQKTASQFGIMSIPTFVFIKNGKEVERKIGMQSKEKMEETVKELLAG